MAPDKRGVEGGPEIYVLFPYENIILWPSETRQRGVSNEYHNMFSWRYKKNINNYLLIKTLIPL